MVYHSNSPIDIRTSASCCLVFFARGILQCEMPSPYSARACCLQMTSQTSQGDRGGRYSQMQNPMYPHPQSGQWAAPGGGMPNGMMPGQQLPSIMDPRLMDQRMMDPRVLMDPRMLNGHPGLPPQAAFHGSPFQMAPTQAAQLHYAMQAQAGMLPRPPQGMQRPGMPSDSSPIRAGPSLVTDALTSERNAEASTRFSWAGQPTRFEPGKVRSSACACACKCHARV